jgi:prevent-host-death family protein
LSNGYARATPRNDIKMRHYREPGGLDKAYWFVKLVGMKTQRIGSFDAKTHLSELLQKVGRGQVYVITRRGKPLAELRPVQGPRKAGLFGNQKGLIKISADFDAPLADFKDYTR